MPKKNIPINYSARDYDSIRQSLTEHAKRYYSDTFKDFNEAGFGSLALDTVSYVGDVLSFYLDYQANESFLNTSIEPQNILRHAKPMGFRLRENPSSFGIATFFVLVPANTNGSGPDTSYIPILKKNSIFSTPAGNNFILNEDVFFDGEENDIVVGRVNATTGIPTDYVIRSTGQIMSGRYEETTITIGNFKKFLKVELPINNIAEIILVEDAEGNDYYEVEYLSQDVIYRPILNRTNTDRTAPSIMKPYTVPRRFIVEAEGNKLYLQFGHGSDTTTDTTSEKLADPSSMVLQVHGKDYYSDESFDPSNLIQTDKFGIAPANTTLRVVARVNTVDNVNAGVDTVVNVETALIEFDDPASLDTATVRNIRSSLEVTNEEAIVGDVTIPDAEEIKKRIYNSFAAQNRAVTMQDYQALIYSMPPVFGSVKRARVVRDADSFKRNMNVYIISEDSDGLLTTANSVLKENLRTWLNKNKMMNDTIDILDAKIVNYGIEFSIVADFERNKHDILTDAIAAVEDFVTDIPDIGEPFFMTDIYTVLKDVEGVVDVTRVKLKEKCGGLYADTRFQISDNTSADGRYVEVPENVIMEMKFPEADIKGTVK